MAGKHQKMYFSFFKIALFVLPIIGFSNLTPINSIEIIPPITYQETFTSTKNNFLDEKVAKFYGLG